MHHLEIWRDINDTVRAAIDDSLHMLDERELVRRSDAILATLPVMGPQQPTTLALLKRYQGRLQQELCIDRQPRINAFRLAEEELVEITRGVMVALEGEGISIEAAVYVALVIRARGLAKLCAAPPASGARL